MSTNSNSLSLDRGELILFNAGELKFLYKNRYDLPSWSLDELYQRFCTTPYGIEILHEAMDYEGLVRGGAIDYMVEKELWLALLCFKQYERLNWAEARKLYISQPKSRALIEGSSRGFGFLVKTVADVYKEAIVEAEKYELMAIDKLCRKLLFKKDLGLWLASFNRKKRNALLAKLEEA